MPQIWLTYDEMAEAFSIPPGEVRSRCVELGLARMKSSDGTSRVRLSSGHACHYLAGLLADQAGEAQGARHEGAALEAMLRERRGHSLGGTADKAA